jgi:hypothetical protein
MVNLIRVSHLKKKVSNIRNQGRLNRLRLEAKLNNSEKSNMNLRRRKKLKRILALVSLSMVICSIAYFHIPSRTFLLGIRSTFLKTDSMVTDSDKLVETPEKGGSQLCKVGILLVIVTKLLIRVLEASTVVEDVYEPVEPVKFPLLVGMVLFTVMYSAWGNCSPVFISFVASLVQLFQNK